MKSFKEYVELREEKAYAEQMLNEDPITLAAAIIGYAGAGLLLGWAGAIILSGYTKLASKFISGVKRSYRRLFKKNKSTGDITKTIVDLKKDPKVKIQQNNIRDEDKKYQSEFQDIVKSIADKNADITKASLKSIKLNSKIINRKVILEATKTFGEPPLHFGNTGNDCYLFIKKVLGIKVAQAASFMVKKALEEKGAELVQNVDDENENENE